MGGKEGEKKTAPSALCSTAEEEDVTETTEGAHCDSGSIFLSFFFDGMSRTSKASVQGRGDLSSVASGIAAMASTPLPTGLSPPSRPIDRVGECRAPCGLFFELPLSSFSATRNSLRSSLSPPTFPFVFSPLWLENFTVPPSASALLYVLLLV